MKALLTHIGLSVSGVVAYGYASVVGSLLLFMFMGMDIGLLPAVLAMAALMGVDAHRIASGKALPVLITHACTFGASVLVTMFPGLVTWAL